MKRWFVVLVALMGTLIFIPGNSFSAAAKICTTFTPELRDFTVNQGLNTYPVLARGKAALVRGYLMLPSCADVANGAAAEIDSASLTITNGTPATTTVAAYGSPFPSYVLTSGTTTSINSNADPKFLVPGSVYTSSSTARFTTNYSLTITYKIRPNSATAYPTTASSFTYTTLTGSTARLAKTVEKLTNALRILAVPISVPLSDTSADPSLSSFTAGLNAFARAYPVTDGTNTDPTKVTPAVGDLLTTTGGVRYHLDAGVASPLADGSFPTTYCASTTNPPVPQFDTNLQGFRQAWNSTHGADNQADKVVGVGDAALIPASGCYQGYAWTNTNEAWVRASPNQVGPLLAQEVEHTWGMIPAPRADASNPFHSTHINADYATGDLNRAYDVPDALFLSPNYSSMRFNNSWTNTNFVLEQPDYSDVLCFLGGATTSECTTSGTTGTAVGVPASPLTTSFVVTGTIDRSTNKATILETYVADTTPTPSDPSSPYHIAENGSVPDTPIPVSFTNSAHDEGGGTNITTNTIGVFSVAVPLGGATQIQLKNGSTPVTCGTQACIWHQTVAPAVTPQPVIPFRSLTAAKRAHRTSRISRRSTRRLQANGDPIPGTPITADQSGTGCQTKANENPPGGIGVGIAFDGTNLLLSCEADNTISVVSPADGHQIAHYAVSGMSGTLGALAWDNTRHVIWACQGINAGTVGVIDPTTHAFTAKFSVPGCRDGLAYDASDDTIWTSPDATNSITHSTTSGTVLGTFDQFSLNGGGNNNGGNSGIAVGGSLLYLANDGGSQIYTSPKNFSTSPTLFATLANGARAEDMECDNVTFASSGKTALWSVDAYDRTLNAWEIPNGSCSFGGGGGASSVTYDVKDSDSPPDQIRTDIFEDNGDGTLEVLAVGVAPTSTTTSGNGGTATFTYPDTGCQANATIYARASDSFLTSGSPTSVGTCTVDTPETPVSASISNPAPNTTVLSEDGITLDGSGWSSKDGVLSGSQLSWSSPLFAGTKTGAHVVVAPDPAGSLWTPGTYDITLTATDSRGKTATATRSITIVADSDRDRIPANIDGPSCAGGADSDPYNWAADYNNNGIPNGQELFITGNPCAQPPFTYVGIGLFAPQTFTIPPSSPTVALNGIYVPYANLSLIDKATVKISDINGNPASIPTVRNGWAVSGNLGAAVFDSNALASALTGLGLTKGSVAITVTGSTPSTVSAAFSFKVTSSLTVKSG